MSIEDASWRRATAATPDDLRYEFVLVTSLGVVFPATTTTYLVAIAAQRRRCLVLLAAARALPPRRLLSGTKRTERRWWNRCAQQDDGNDDTDVAPSVDLPATEIPPLRFRGHLWASCTKRDGLGYGRAEWRKLTFP